MTVIDILALGTDLDLAHAIGFETSFMACLDLRNEGFLLERLAFLYAMEEIKRPLPAKRWTAPYSQQRRNKHVLTPSGESRI